MDQEALIRALSEGRLRGAAPWTCSSGKPLPPESPLWDLPGVLVFPHNAFAGEGTHRRLLDLAVPAGGEVEGAFLNGETLYRQLEQAPELKGRLFRYGYLIAEADVDLPRALPVLSDWRALPFGDLRIWLHPEQRAFFHRGPAGDLFLIGHCYDPFAREHREEACLAKLSAALEEGGRGPTAGP